MLENNRNQTSYSYGLASKVGKAVSWIFEGALNLIA